MNYFESCSGANMLFLNLTDAKLPEPSAKVAKIMCRQLQWRGGNVGHKRMEQTNGTR